MIFGLCLNERVELLWSIPAVLAVGFVAYGLSIYVYVYAQRLLGAARTSAYYAVAPFIAAMLSLIVFQELPTITYFAALVLMMLGAWLAAQDKPLVLKFSAWLRKPQKNVDCPYFSSRAKECLLCDKLNRTLTRSLATQLLGGERS